MRTTMENNMEQLCSHCTWAWGAGIPLSFYSLQVAGHLTVDFWIQWPWRPVLFRLELLKKWHELPWRWWWLPLC